MNERSFWVRTAVILIAIAAGAYLVQAVGRLWEFMGGLFMLFFFGWLLGSMLLHFVNGLMTVPLMRRPIAIIIIYLGLSALVADFLFLILPAAGNQLLELSENLPSLLERIPEVLRWVERLLPRFGIEGLDLVGRYKMDLSIDGLIEDGANWVVNNFVVIAQAAGSAVFAVFLVIALSFYVVLDGGRRLNEALTVLPPRVEEEVRLVLRTFDEIFHGYVRGMMLVSLIYGVAVATVMMATGLPAALPSAIVASLLLAVPFVGDILALLLPLLIAFLAGDVSTFVIVLATLGFVQQGMLNLLTPRIIGRAVGMPAGLVVVAVLVGARLAGIPGALLGVPAGAVIYSLAVVYGNRVRQRREHRNRTDSSEPRDRPPDSRPRTVTHPQTEETPGSRPRVANKSEREISQKKKPPSSEQSQRAPD